LHLETNDPVVRRLFREGIAGLQYALPRWDYRSKWSWYHRSYLSPPAYHNLNCLLLEVLATLSEQPVLAEYAKRWNPKRLSTSDRAEIYLGFVLTKNANRLRRQTWRRKAHQSPDGFVRAGASADISSSVSGDLNGRQQARKISASMSTP